MQKSKSKKRVISVKNKSSGSWVLYFALVLLLLVIAFFVFKGITGNVISTERGSQTFEGGEVWKVLAGVTDLVGVFYIDDGNVYVTGVNINWTDYGGKCQARVIAGSYNSGFVDIGDNVKKGFPGINQETDRIKIKANFDDPDFYYCSKIKINSVIVWYNKTCETANTNWGSCNSTGQQNRTQNCVLEVRQGIGCPVYSCNGTIPTNATLCSNDDSGLTVNVTRTLKEDCSSPAGSAPKCEYTCNDRYSYSISNGVCVPDATPTYTCNAPLFCNTSSVAHSDRVLGKTCESGTCSNCSATYAWNGSACVTACNKLPGCQVSFANATNVSGFCPTSGQKCYECNSDYTWNGTKCVLQQCTSLPGCRNESSLANANNKTRFCAVGKCFACNSGYTWNNASSACLATTGWSNISFTDAEFVAGTIATFQVYGRVYFTFNSNRYWVGLISTDITSLTANVRIDPVMNKTLSIDVENKIDLNADGVSDIILRLDDVGNGEADIYIKKIVAVVQTGGTPDTSDNDIFVSTEPEITPDTSAEESATGSGSGSLFWVIILLVVLIIIIVFAIFFMTRKKQEPMRTDTNNVVPVNGPVVVQSPARPIVRPVQPMRQAVSAQGIQKPTVTNVPAGGDIQVAADIRKQIDIGNHFVVDGKILPAKAVYSKISEMYKTLKMPNDKLYSEIVDYYKKLVK
jgi:hypothetical protein